MSFCLNARDIYRIRDYAHAVETYHAYAPWKGEAEVGMWRCLDRYNKRKRHVAFRINTANGDVECRLYRTNVVTYHKDDTITIKPYQSMSTDNFARAILPSDFYTRMMCGEGSAVGVTRPDEPHFSAWCGAGKRYYRLYTKGGQYGRSPGLRLKKVDGYWTPAEEPLPFERYTLDRKKTRAALKEHRYHDFAAFARGVQAVGGGRLDTTDAKYGFGTDAALACLDDQSRWMDLIKAYHRRWGVQTFVAAGLLERIRLAIYHGAGVVTVDEVPYVDGYKSLLSLDAAARKYSRL